MKITTIGKGNAGGLENARALEDFLATLFSVSQSLGGPVSSRITPTA